MKAQILKKTDAALDICTFELGSPDGKPLPAFSAGAHIDVHLGEDLVRQYSLCNHPDASGRYVIGVLLDPASRGGSRAMHALKEGDILEISEPRNHFPLHGSAEHSILLAGGIGITPILCMAERLANIGASFEMHYCTRSPERTAFRERLAADDFQACCRVYHDSRPEAGKLDLAAVLGAPAPGKHLYVCGPGGFIDAVLSAGRAAGWAEDNLHREYFANVVQAEAGDGPFQVKIASSGQVIDIAADQSITDALAAAGVDIPVSCEQGVCGTCLTNVLEGVPDHRDLYLTDEEREANDQMLPCCSRAKSSMLVLDL
ncbi:oxidoreductase [Verticiella sediminum]|uniref:Oxidoreductase n=1 Tax=Verticiella sediminum TaxID=1247510 RepID=A0A556AZV8_9BURK|nr:PDR/VanB family oxidoreductase [Verticiella sediminum]TSH98005.1 oxidoreductase [Verticiella sediminum]